MSKHFHNGKQGKFHNSVNNVSQSGILKNVQPLNSAPRKFTSNTGARVSLKLLRISVYGIVMGGGING